MDQKHIAVLVNPAAGKGRARSIAEKVAVKLRTAGVQMELYYTQWPQSLTDFTDVFLIGGDGTLNYFINSYRDCILPVALIPAGSGNDFAWKLNGKKTWEESFEIAMNGTIMAVDAGTCNGKFFINGVGIGFDGQVVKNMGRKRFISASHLAYLLTVLREILFFQSVRLMVDWDESQEVFKVFMISIANGSRYGGGFLVAPQASITDGLLELVTIKELGVLSRLKHLPAMEKGKHLHLPFMQNAVCKKVLIKSDHVLPAHLDGELMEASEFDIRILVAHFRFRCMKINQVDQSIRP